MASGRLIDYLGRGVFADRPATPDLAAGGLGFYYATDTNTLYAWDGSAWDTVTSGGSGVASVVAGTNISVNSADPANPIVSAPSVQPFTTTATQSGTSLTALPAAAWSYIRFTNAAAKTYTFDSAQSYVTNTEFHGRNVGAGSLTLTAAGSFVLTAPAGGSLVVAQGQSFIVKITGTNTADVILQLGSGSGPPAGTPATLSDAAGLASATATTHTYTFPATVNAGDLIIILYANASAAAVTDSGVFTRQHFTSGRAVYTKVCAGTEGGTTVNIGTVGATQAWSVWSVRVAAGTFDATNPLGFGIANSAAAWETQTPTAPTGGWNNDAVQWISAILANSAAATYAYGFANNRFPSPASTSSRTTAVSTGVFAPSVVAGRGLANSISVSSTNVLIGINPVP